MIGKLLMAAMLIGLAVLWWQNRKRAVAKMSPGEARALLGVAMDARSEDIQEAHRRLIARVHPDAGGSAELAARVNNARDVLLAHVPPSLPR